MNSGKVGRRGSCRVVMSQDVEDTCSIAPRARDATDRRGRAGGEAEAVTSAVTTSASAPPAPPSFLKFGVGAPSRSCVRAVPARKSAALRSRSTQAGACTEHKRRKRPSPTLALAPNHDTGPTHRRPYQSSSSTHAYASSSSSLSPSAPLQ
jgi:hypothetical protein